MKYGCKHGYEFIEYCSLHAAAEQMLEALKDIANDCNDISRLPEITKGERRAWLAVRNKAKNALATVRM